MEISNSSSCSSNDVVKWTAEQSIAGNTEALQSLRELITYPLLYSHEAKKLGLKVYMFINIYIHTYIYIYNYSLILLFVVALWFAALRSTWHWKGIHIHIHNIVNHLI